LRKHALEGESGATSKSPTTPRKSAEIVNDAQKNRIRNKYLSKNRRLIVDSAHDVPPLTWLVWDGETFVILSRRVMNESAGTYYRYEAVREIVDNIEFEGGDTAPEIPVNLASADQEPLRETIDDVQSETLQAATADEATHAATADEADNGVPAGVITEYAGITAPTGWLMCYGQAVCRTTYADLFAALTADKGTFTVTIASPGVVTLAGHGLITGDCVALSTTGALPTGLSTATNYYIIKLTADTFKLASSLANAQADTAINTSGSQSGTHTLFLARTDFGSAHFIIPTARGVFPRWDSMGIR
jgi:microcystin-dependent protein